MKPSLYIILLNLCFMTAIAPEIQASDPTPDGEDDIRVAILRLLHEGIPSHDIGARPAHPLTRDPAALAEMSSAILEAATAYRIDPYLLVAVALREGSFSPAARGGLGERSTYQMIPATARRVVRRLKEHRCSLDTIRGATWCVAAWLAHWRDICSGSMKGALTVYATGKGCSSTVPRVRWLVRDRLGIAAILRAMVRGEPGRGGEQR